MNLYVLSGDHGAIDASLVATLKSLQLKTETLRLPSNHEDVAALFSGKEGGIVFLPAVWSDLLSVKVIQEIVSLSLHLETVIVGPIPETRQLIMAFNEGLTAYLPTPVLREDFDHIFRRTVTRFERRGQEIFELEQLRALERKMEIEEGNAPGGGGLNRRNHFLGKAFVDLVHKTGPISKGNVSILLVSSSPTQRSQLQALLKTFGIQVTETTTMADALKLLKENSFTVVISDNVLPDGNAVALSQQIRKICQKIPKIVVWSSSPEKVHELLQPENFIDEIVLKTSPEKGLESVLPQILALIYQY